MKPDIKTLQRFREARDAALWAPLLSDEERKAQAQRVADQAARDEVRRAPTPQLPLEARNG